MLIAALFIIAKSWNQPNCLTNGRMNTEHVVPLHNEIFSSIKNEDILSFVGKSMELENILSEVSQTQKDMCGMYSQISGY